MQSKFPLAQAKITLQLSDLNKGQTIKGFTKKGVNDQ